MFKLVDTFYVDTVSEKRALARVLNSLFAVGYVDTYITYCRVITTPQGNVYTLKNEMFIVKYDHAALQYCVQCCKKV